MKFTAKKRSLLVICLLLLALIISACSKAPEDVLSWL